MEELFIKHITDLGGIGAIFGFIAFLLWKKNQKTEEKQEAKNEKIAERYDKIIDTHLDNAKGQTEAISQLNDNVKSSGVLIFKEIKNIIEGMDKLAKADIIKENHEQVMKEVLEMREHLSKLIEKRFDEKL